MRPILPSIFIVFILFTSGQIIGQHSDNSGSGVTYKVYDQISKIYAYDKSIPINPKILSVNENEFERVEKIIFRGANNTTVPAYLILPPGSQVNIPVILIVDGVYGSKQRWFDDDSWPRGGLLRKSFIKSGFGVMVLDAVYHGERSYENNFQPPCWLDKCPHTGMRMITQTAVEYRQAIDYLESRPEIDSLKIGMAGISMGGMITFALSSVDTRLKSAAACVTPIYNDRLLSAVDPFTFSQHLNSESFLMLMGTTDDHYSMSDAQKLFATIEVPVKDLISYEGGHQPPAEYVQILTDWFSKNLK